MAWLSRVNFTAADVLSYTALNNLGNDDRAWGGDVNGGGFKLSNVILSSGISITAPTVTAVFTIVSAASVPLVKVLDNGRMGIGTGTPISLLDVYNTTPSMSAATVQQIAATGTNYGLSIGATGTGATGNTALWINVAGATNNVGINIVGPAAGASNYAIQSNSTAQSYFAGAVGIGISPGAPLHVYNSTPGIQAAVITNQSSSGANYGLQINATGVGGSINHGLFISASGATTNYGIVIPSPTAGANNYAIYANGGAQSYFAGAVGILTTAPFAVLDVVSGNKPISGIGSGIGSCRIAVASGISANTLLMGADSGQNVSWIQALRPGITTDSLALQPISGSVLIGYSVSNGGYALQVNSQIFATSATIATSDGRYKTNVQPIKDALLLVNGLNPVQFDWMAHPVHNFDLETTQIGFIAQDVQKTLGNEPYCKAIVKPNLCSYEDAEGKEVSETFLGIAEGNMIGLLTAAIQELTVKVLALEGKPR